MNRPHPAISVFVGAISILLSAAFVPAAPEARAAGVCPDPVYTAPGVVITQLSYDITSRTVALRANASNGAWHIAGRPVRRGDEVIDECNDSGSDEITAFKYAIGSASTPASTATCLGSGSNIPSGDITNNGNGTYTIDATLPAGATAGDRALTLCVSANRSASSSEEFSVPAATPANVNCSIVSATPQEPRVGQTVNFAASVTGLTGTITYIWDFGDTDTVTSTSTSLNATASHPYSEVSAPTVSLRASDGTATALCNTSVSVRAAPVTESGFPTYTCDISPTSILEISPYDGSNREPLHAWIYLNSFRKSQRMSDGSALVSTVDPRDVAWSWGLTNLSRADGVSEVTDSATGAKRLKVRARTASGSFRPTDAHTGTVEIQDFTGTTWCSATVNINAVPSASLEQSRAGGARTGDTMYNTITRDVRDEVPFNVADPVTDPEDDAFRATVWRVAELNPDCSVPAGRYGAPYLDIPGWPGSTQSFMGPGIPWGEGARHMEAESNVHAIYDTEHIKSLGSTSMTLKAPNEPACWIVNMSYSDVSAHGAVGWRTSTNGGLSDAENDSMWVKVRYVWPAPVCSPVGSEFNATSPVHFNETTTLTATVDTAGATGLGENDIRFASGHNATQQGSQTYATTGNATTTTAIYRIDAGPNGGTTDLESNFTYNPRTNGGYCPAVQRKTVDIKNYDIRLSDLMLTVDLNAAGSTGSVDVTSDIFNGYERDIMYVDQDGSRAGTNVDLVSSDPPAAASETDARFGGTPPFTVNGAETHPLTFYVDGAQEVATAANPDAYFTNYTFTVRSTSDNGHGVTLDRTATGVLTVRCPVDSLAPGVPTIRDKDNYNDRWFKERRPTFIWNVPTDTVPAGSPAQCQRVKAYEWKIGASGTVQTIYVPRGATGLNTIRVPAQADGRHVFHVRAKDLYNNVSAWDTVDFFVDNVNPEIEEYEVECIAPDCARGAVTAAGSGEPGNGTADVYYVTKNVNARVRISTRDASPGPNGGPPGGFDNYAQQLALIAPSDAPPHAPFDYIGNYELPRVRVISNPLVPADWDVADITQPAPWNLNRNVGGYARFTNEVYVRTAAGSTVGQCDRGTVNLAARTEDMAENIMEYGPDVAGRLPQFRLDDRAPVFVSESYAAGNNRFPNEHTWMNVNRTTLTFRDDNCGGVVPGVGIVKMTMKSEPGVAILAAGADPTIWPSVPVAAQSPAFSSAAPQSQTSVTFPLEEGENTLFIYVEDALGNSQVFRSVYRVDTLAPNACDYSVSITPGTNDPALVEDVVTITMHGTDNRATDSWLSRFRIMRNGQEAFTQDVADAFPPREGAEEASFTLDDTTVTDLSSPNLPTTEPSPTHAVRTWQNDGTLTIRWRITGTAGSTHTYGVRCVDVATNEAIGTLTGGSDTITYRKPETGVRFHIWQWQTGSDTRGNYLMDYVMMYRTPYYPFQPDPPGRVLEANFNVMENSGASYAPQNVAEGASFSIPSGAYVFLIESMTASSQSDPTRGTAEGPYYLDNNDPQCPSNTYAFPNTYGTVDGSFYYSSDVRNMSLTMSAADAHAGVSTAAARPQASEFVLRHTRHVDSSGTCTNCDIPGATVVDGTMRVLPYGTGTVGEQDRMRIELTPRDNVVNATRNARICAESQPVIIDTIPPELDCYQVERDGITVGFIRKSSVYEADTNFRQVDLYVKSQDPNNTQWTVQSVTTPGYGAFTRVNPASTDGEEKKIYRMKDVLLPNRENSVSVKATDYAGNERSATCRIISYPQVQMEVAQSANVSGTLTKAQSDNMEKGEMSDVAFTTSALAAGAKGLLMSTYGSDGFGPADLTNTSLATGVLYDQHPAPSLMTVAGASAHPFGIRFEGRLKAPAEGAYRFAIHLGSSDTGSLRLDAHTGSANVLANGTIIPETVGSGQHPGAGACITNLNNSLVESGIVNLNAQTWYGLRLDYKARAAGANTDTVGLYWMKPGDTCYSKIPEEVLMFGPGGYSVNVQPYVVSATLPPGFAFRKDTGVLVRPASIDTTDPNPGEDVALPLCGTPVDPAAFPCTVIDADPTTGCHLADDPATPGVETPGQGCEPDPDALTPDIIEPVSGAGKIDTIRLLWSFPARTTCEGPASCATQFSTKIPVGRSIDLVYHGISDTAYVATAR